MDHSDACIALNWKLHELPGRKPSQETIMDTIGDEGDPPLYICSAGDLKIEDWLDARALRRELDAAIALG
jgi:hypothetical protein